MIWALTTILCVILVEIVVRLPLPVVISQINVIGRKAMHTLGTKSVSDHWKEKAILAYAFSLFFSTIKIAGYLVAIGVVAVFLVIVFDYFGVMVGEFIMSWRGVLFSFIVATLYFMIRKFFV